MSVTLTDVLVRLGEAISALADEDSRRSRRIRTDEVVQRFGDLVAVYKTALEQRAAE